MALLVSSWSDGVKSVPDDYVMPPELRAGDFVTVCKDIPVIDLANDRSESVQKILKACQEYGVFQVINHGVSDKMMKDMVALSDEFFKLPIEDKLGIYSDGPQKGCALFTSTFEHAKEDVHNWKDTLRHPCHPVEEHSPSWPHKPARYKEEVGRYAVQVRKMGLKILDLIAEGLGLREAYFNEVLCENQTMSVHLYPPCPDPSLAMGIASHGDPNLITFLQQDLYGLQIRKDGKWMGVDHISNAFVVNLGYQLHVISNGTLKSVIHRGLLNSTSSRRSIVTFLGPSREHPVVVEPAKELISSSNPRMFKAYRYNEFLEHYLAMYRIHKSEDALDPYRL